MVDEPFVIVTARQSYNNLDWYPGITQPDPEAIRQLYNESSCTPIVQYVDAAQVAASVDAGLLWWGFIIGLSIVLVVCIIAGRGKEYWDER
jgi:hypothetical protein